MSKTSLKIQESKLKKIIWISTVLILVSWLLTYFLLKDLEPDQRGTLGDMFGSVNALFSGLALAGIIFSILLQRLELGYQREELRETRKEFSIQNATLKKQRFENTFFSLVKLYQDILENLHIDDFGRDFKRTKCLERLYQRLNFSILSQLPDDKENTAIEERYLNLEKEQIREVINIAYKNFYRSNEMVLVHWLRTFRNIMEFIDTNSLLDDDSERLFYSSIFVGQLSTSELQILFYHTFSNHDKVSLIQYQKNYDFFADFNETKLLDKTHLVIKTLA